MKDFSQAPKHTDRFGILDNSVFHTFLIIAAAILIYANTFHVPFQFDDVREILRNSNVRNLNNFTHLSTQNTRYVTYLTFALNYALDGINVLGYHVFNLAVHIVNALFVYWLVILSFRTPILKGSSLKDSSKIIGLFSALLFACHPVQTEAVTYIVQRLASLATLFYLFSIIAYGKARLGMHESGPKAKPLLWYGVSLLSAILAMKTKEIAFTLPVMLTLYEFMFFKAETKKRIGYLLPFLLTMLIIPISLIGISKPIGDVIGDVSGLKMGQIHFSRWDYLFTEFRVITTYIRLLFLPVNQNLIYDYPIFHSFFNKEVFLSFLFLLSIFVLGIYLFYRYRRSAPHSVLISFGIFWFFITLSVESSIIPISDVIFEHRLYLPSVGFFISLVTSLIWVRSRFMKNMPAAGKAVLPLLAVATIALCAGTFHRNTIWKNDLTLWSDVVKKSPDAQGPRNNLGNAYEKRGLTDKAIEQYQIVLRHYPNDARAHENIGVAFFRQGLMDKAMDEFQTAIQLQPNFYDAYYNMGLVFFQKGQIEKAIEQYKKAIKIRPGFAEAYVALGIAYGAAGSTDRATEYLQRAVQLNPYLAEAHNNLGIAYEKSGSAYEAIGEFQAAVKLQPDYANARYNLGRAYLASGSAGKAIEQLQITEKLEPDFFDAHYQLGRAYMALGSTDKAIEQFQRTIKLKPDFAEAHKYLGDALYKDGSIDLAIEQFQRAIALKHGYTEAHKNLGDAFVRKGALDQAIQQYLTASRLDPRLVDALYNLGVVYYNKGSADKAREYFQRVLKLRPDFAEAHNSLGSVYLKMGTIDKAVAQFQTAVKLNPSNSLFQNNLNNAYNYQSKIRGNAGNDSGR